MPIYIVKNKATAQSAHQPPGTQQLTVEEVKLVRAVTKAGARNYVAAQSITVEAASDEDLINLTKKGVEVQDAGKE